MMQAKWGVIVQYNGQPAIKNLKYIGTSLVA